jgi:hypothetical protein
MGCGLRGRVFGQLIHCSAATDHWLIRERDPRGTLSGSALHRLTPGRSLQGRRPLATIRRWRATLSVRLLPYAGGEGNPV